MTVKFEVWNPTGNKTVLVETPIEIQRQSDVALQLMRQIPEAEQVGFVSENRLRMAGGEFCGNATMSAAARLSLLRDVQIGSSVENILSVSGVNEAVTVKTVRIQQDLFECSLCMPKPKNIQTVRLSANGVSYELPFVSFEGIGHLIMENTMTRNVAESAVRDWCEELAVDALGIMFWDRNQNALTPLVYVPAAQTMCWESSCASGTTALCAYLSAQTGRDVCLSLNEPGGMLNIESAQRALILTGTAMLEKKGVCNV